MTLTGGDHGSSQEDFLKLFLPDPPLNELSMRINTSWLGDVLWWQISESTSACCLRATNHYLNQYWLLISEVLWHSPESNFTASTQATVLYHEIENYTSRIAATSPRVLCVYLYWVTTEKLQMNLFFIKTGKFWPKAPRLSHFSGRVFVNQVYFTPVERPPLIWDHPQQYFWIGYTVFYWNLQYTCTQAPRDNSTSENFQPQLSFLPLLLCFYATNAGNITISWWVRNCKVQCYGYPSLEKPLMCRTWHDSRFCEIRTYSWLEIIEKYRTWQKNVTLQSSLFLLMSWHR